MANPGGRAVVTYAGGCEVSVTTAQIIAGAAKPSCKARFGIDGTQQQEPTYTPYLVGAGVIGGAAALIILSSDDDDDGK